MASFQCAKCEAVFADNAHLKRHQARKTPCDPVVQVDAERKGLSCRYCGRAFTTRPALSRHERHRCKIANPGGEAEEPANRVPQQVIQEAEVAALRAEVARLGAEVERLVARSELPATILDKKLDGRAAMSEREQVISAAQAARGQAERGLTELAYLLETVGAPVRSVPPSG
jgi:ribosomal protein L37AE/L43A